MLRDSKTGVWMSGGKEQGQDEPQAAVPMGIKPSSWKPSSSANFRPYHLMRTDKRTRPPKTLHIVVSPSIAVKLTKYLVETYKNLNPSFTYSDTFNPKRYLTNPSAGVSNNGLDNKNSDLILAVNGVLSHPRRRYVVKEMLGQGTFGQVVKCWSEDAENFVAVKVIKNQPAYYQQALVEIEILKMLNHKFDPDDNHHIVRILDYFIFEEHLCIAFELLSHNLYELIKFNRHRGISLHLLRTFTKQILDALAVLRDAGVIHCDLKPENILLSTSLKSGEIKLIDFGSACLETRTVYSYIQSRFYRSPEVVLGHPYTTAIDMWSLGCVAAELFLGLPLFAGDSEYDLLRRMINTLGCQPPDQLLRRSTNTNKYFKNVSAAPPLDGGTSAYQFLTKDEYKARENKDPVIGKTYFKHTKLEDMISFYPYKSTLSAEEVDAERNRRLMFLDFLRGLVRFDPKSRWTPHQAAQHPFITEEPFTGSFEPPPETPRTPVGHAMTVEHNPGAGHWFGAGLSPQVSHLGGPPFGSPQYRFSFASSYGSCGSYGSYGSCDGFGVGGSYGSYNDVTNMYFNYPTPPGGPPIGGFESWRRMPPAIGYAPVGISPSNSVFKPMSLGGSPSQFTPPGSQFPSPSSSQSSPGRYGPPSPHRYVKSGQYKQRRGFCPPPLSQSTGFPLPYDGARHAQPNGFEAYGNHMEVGPSGSHSRPHGQSHLRPQSQARSSHYKINSLESMLSRSEAISESSESAVSHSDGGHWFPDDSNDLLEEENHNHKQHQPQVTGMIGGGGSRLGPVPGGFPIGAGYHSGSLKASRYSDSLHFSQASGTSVLCGSIDETQTAYIS